MMPFEDGLALNQCPLYSAVLPIGGIDRSIKQGLEVGLTHLSIILNDLLGEFVFLVTAHLVSQALVFRERMLPSSDMARIPLNLKLRLLPSYSHIHTQWGTRLFLGTPSPKFEGKWASTIAMGWIWPFNTTGMSSRWPSAQSPQGWESGSPHQVSHSD